MTLLLAGFNRVSNVGTWGQDYVATAGLGNCIAVCGTDAVTRNIAIAHYDTLHCGVEQGQEVVVTRLTAFRDWFRHRTHTTEFYVGLGMVWSHESEYRTPFLDACTEVFGGWPRPIGDGIFFFHESGAFHMQATPPEAGALNDHNWTTAGTLIPYSALVPGGVPEGKCVIM